ncbi:hypothetical protein ACI3LY_001560 [Candidozyma auris]|uniref:Uncharacterized protein n=1 Tax=Candidozyma auris TaxID=498019 RepID=A0A2H0ZY02_CANAR|nr:hypothetical protein QG37_05330 [[Candida] auris]PIS55536.1 hypothetical protein B9J08_001638 [[Candida] auris]
MRTSFHIGPGGPLLTVKHQISNIPSLEYLQSLSPRSFFTLTYKHFFRLRHLISDRDYHQDQYLRLLKRRFLRGDFNLRRQKVLGIHDDLAHGALVKRIYNTYIFVFNATCNMKDEPETVKTYDDVKRVNRPRLETQILQTILKLEEQAPIHVRLDTEYRWLDEASKREQELVSGMIDKKRAKELNKSREVVDIGYADYERMTMALNESLDLCL